MLTFAFLIFLSRHAVAEDTLSAQLDAARPAETAPSLGDLSGGVGAYRALGVHSSPAAAAAFARWEAAVHQAGGARALPDPRIGLGVFVRSVETRVGPQQARLSVQQALPWPAEWRGRVGAASAEAQARAADFEAVVRALHDRIETSYWQLWEQRATRAVHEDHLAVLSGLSEVVRVRLEVGGATLADLQQVDLSAARLEDRIASLRTLERRAEAELRAAIGLTGSAPLPTAQPPPQPSLPAQPLAALLSLAAEHPATRAAGFRADAATATVQATQAQRLPGLSLSADWILVGDAAQPGVEDSGRDAAAVGVGLSIPVWQRAYAAKVDAAKAQAQAAAATREGAIVERTASITRWHEDVGDSARRAKITAGTLLPQAEGAYASLLGSYTTGDGSVAQVLLAQRDLLELRVALAQSLALHARAWAGLEAQCGPIQRQSTEGTP